MKAIGLYKYLPIDDEQSLVDVEIDTPRPTERDLLVRVRAISVNPVDVKVRARQEQTEKRPRILGWDAAGIVEAVGSNCTLFKPGDEVYYAGDLTRPGTNSELHGVDERIVGRKPKTLDFAQAAALPLTTITAWEGLFERMTIPRQPELNRGKRILIIGSAGGVGSIATQLAHWAGLTVIGTASRPETIQWAKEHGVNETIDHHQPFESQLLALNIPSVDYIFCLNSLEQHWDNMAKVLAPQGKICSIVEATRPIDVSDLRSRSGTFAWEFMFTRPMYRTSDMIEQHNLLNAVADLIDEGILKSTLNERLSPINASTLRQAHAQVERGSMIGKLALEDFPA